jgi:hypothetical protein
MHFCLLCICIHKDILHTHICNTIYVNADIFSQLGITMASDEAWPRMTPRVIRRRLPWHHQPYDLLVLKREWMGCWGLLGWLLLVMTGIIPENSLLSTSKMTIWIHMGPSLATSISDCSPRCCEGSMNFIHPQLNLDDQATPKYPKFGAETSH